MLHYFHLDDLHEILLFLLEHRVIVFELDPGQFFSVRLALGFRELVHDLVGHAFEHRVYHSLSILIKLPPQLDVDVLNQFGKLVNPYEALILCVSFLKILKEIQIVVVLIAHLMLSQFRWCTNIGEPLDPIDRPIAVGVDDFYLTLDPLIDWSATFHEPHHQLDLDDVELVVVIDVIRAERRPNLHDLHVGLFVDYHLTTV